MENKLGNYVKEFRTKNKLSLRDFGKICDISHTHIDSIEKGYDFRTGKRVNITNETLQKLSKVLNVPASYLLNLSLNIDDNSESYNNAAGKTSKRKILLLARHLDKIPEEKREKLIENFKDSIDVYLDALGIEVDEED